MSVKCGGALWGGGTHTHIHTHTHTQPQPHTPAPPASPLATAAVLQEAAVPLADQILSVTFPLINGHLLPPFSLHGYTLSLCSSNHLIVMTFDPGELVCLGGAPAFARLAARTSRPPSCLPACHAAAGERRGHANKQTNEAAFICSHYPPLQRCSLLPNFCWSSLVFAETGTYSVTTLYYCRFLW